MLNETVCENIRRKSRRRTCEASPKPLVVDLLFYLYAKYLDGLVTLLEFCIEEQRYLEKLLSLLMLNQSRITFNVLQENSGPGMFKTVLFCDVSVCGQLTPIFS